MYHTPLVVLSAVVLFITVFLYRGCNFKIDEPLIKTSSDDNTPKRPFDDSSCLLKKTNHCNVPSNYFYQDLWRSHKPCEVLNIYNLIDESKIDAIECILNECPERMMTVRIQEISVTPLHYALLERKFDVALSIANHSAPLWNPLEDFGVHIVHYAFKIEQWEILDVIFNHSSCQQDSQTYCNRASAILLQIPNMLELIVTQVRIMVQHRKAVLILEEGNYYEELKRSNATYRDVLYEQRCEKTQLCYEFCSQPGTCLVSEISFD